MHDFIRRLLEAALAILTTAAPPPALLHQRAPSLAVPPILTAADANPSDTLPREQCLSISLDLRAATECGDLRLAHALPAVRTLQKDRAPVLVYNSDHASPHPVVATNAEVVTAGLAHVTATLRVNGRPRATQDYQGSAWPASGRARIALAYDASGDSTNLYRYTIDVTAYYATDSATTRTSGRIAVVNRSASVFGAGWWVDGLEQLLLDPYGNPGMWIGGDGSVRRYSAVAGNPDRWTAPSVDRPDVLQRTSNGFERLARNGVRVEFDANGRHVGTVNRLGHTTTFTYDANHRLSTISVPPLSANAGYTFAYDVNNRLSSVTLTAGSGAGTLTRVTSVASASGRVNTITDPDGIATQFGYSDPSSRITQRINKRGAITHFRYSATLSKVVGAMTELRDSYGTLTDSIVTTIVPAELMGKDVATDVALVSTTLDGPRTDVADTTRFYLDRFSAPRLIRDALGHETTIARTDSRFPVLVTGVTTPMGFTTLMAYDARGNPDSVTQVNPYADGRNATTHYTWDGVFDEMTSMRSAEGVTTVRAIDPANGNVLSQYTGDPSRSAQFSYYASGAAAGLMRASQLPTGERDSMSYDVLSGNLLAAQSPKGVTMLRYSDALGQDTLTISPVDSDRVDSASVTMSGTRSRVAYDAMGRPAHQWTIGALTPRTVGPATEIVHVATTYDGGGLPLIVSRDMAPDSNAIGTMADTTQYDSDGRPVRMANAGSTRTMRYNAAGQLISTNHGDSTRYDALGRPTQHFLPRVDADLTGADTAGGLPEHLDGAPADVELFTYDADGHVLSADNADARVHRHYAPSGAMLIDSLLVRRYAGTVFDATPVRYSYDLDGRVRTLRHGQWSGVSDTSDVVTYLHDASTGLLSTVTDPEGAVFQYGYDRSDRMTSLVTGAARLDTMVYDADSRVVARDSGEVLARDARGKLVQRIGGPDNRTYTWTYSPLGNLRFMTRSAFNSATVTYAEHYRTDPMGNADSVQVSGATPPMPRGDVDDRNEVRHYDQNRGSFAGSWHYISTPSDSAGWRDANDSQYDGFGRLGQEQTYAIVQRTIVPNCGGTAVNCYASTTDVTTRTYSYDANDRTRFLRTNRYEHYYYGGGDTNRVMTLEYRYDALGRRVLARYRGPNTCKGQNTVECRGYFDGQRWVGSQLLAETRTMAGSYLGTGTGFSGQVTYTQGPEIDRPLSMHRTSPSCQFSVYPKTNFMGQLASGVFRAPMPSCARVDWAGSEGLPYRNTSTYAANAPWNGSLADLNGGDASGLQYMRNRYYNPATGQFTQADPIGLAGGINLYGFAGGDPVNFSDPVGLCPEWVDGKPCDLKAAASFAAGVGDALTFGGTNWVRDKMGTNDVVDKEGAAYVGGQITGIVVGTALGESVVGHAAQTITEAYKRPSYSVTAAQRAAVQGGSCVTCGATGKMVADHITPLVQEYYQTGTIDKTRMRSIGAVQPQCPTCSARQGAAASQYSKAKKAELGIP